MAPVVLTPRIQDDFERIFDFLCEHAPQSAVQRIDEIVAAIDVLESSPQIGRPLDDGKRELVIATGASGYIALYQYVSAMDTVFILALRSRREAGYRF